MRKTFVETAIHLLVVAVLLTACNKQDVLIPPTPPGTPQPENGFFAVNLKAAITVGDVVYDSIPATFTLTYWDVNNVSHQKDTSLDAGVQVVYLPKNALKYSLKMQKWGVTYEKNLNKSEVTEGALYQLGGYKEPKRLKWVSEERFENGSFVLSSKQEFIYDAQGRINEIHAYAPDPNDGVLRSGNSDLFLYGENELWINNVSKDGQTMWGHTAYTFDGQGRTIQSKIQFLNENHIYTNQYTNDGIRMLVGANATNPNGSRIELRFLGGNRVEEKTIIPNYANTIKSYSYDFNINPYVIINMPSMYFEHNSKNNILAESWEGNSRIVNEYKYD
ncbi:MAG: hypothetical protein ACXWV5_07760, partial [Flavitalea sp.]